MKSCTSTRGRDLRRGLQAGVAALAVLTARPASADTGVTVLQPAPSGGGVVTPYYGKLRAFYGKLRAFDGNISPYYGNVGAFYGKLRAFGGGGFDAFWGNLGAFSTGLGANTGSTPPDYANISTFTGDLSDRWDAISTSWNALGSGGAAADYGALGGQLSALVSRSAAFWGASVQARTGRSFNDAFAQPLLAKYGIDLSNPGSLANVSADQRAYFIVDWYDHLMEFTGTDHVDHWMSEADWSPALTQIQGAGARTVIGLLDFTVVNAPDIQARIVKSGGVSTFSDGHGAAVASLIVSAHDGTGVMGIAPSAQVVAYNPFDATGTAGWADVTRGVSTLLQNKASVINASLGVPGLVLPADWNTVFNDKTVKPLAKNAVFVIAAGNSGVSQTTNIKWNPGNPNFLLVGSVDPNLNISDFSNRPGNACLTGDDGCNGDYLKNHFIVAPGEFILVSDDQGGFTRMSGTSFAAPLVSGAIALLHDRWPWLAQHSDATVDIILKSARDLGAPGVDPVYGAGLLDVTASQSPLDYGKLTFMSTTSGKQTVVTTATLRDPKQQATWEAAGFSVTAFEAIDGTFRDFSIPLSSKLVGQTALSASGRMDQFQSYLTSRFTTWINSPAAAAKSQDNFLGFTARADAAPVASVGGLDIAMSARPEEPDAVYRPGAIPFATSVSVTAPRAGAGLRFGYGDGAGALGGQAGFAENRDHDLALGGANPLLGLASGAGYLNWSLAVAPRLAMSAGMTARDDRRDLSGLSGQDRLAALGAGDFRATAQHLGLSWMATDRLSLVGGLTRLNEDRSLLGIQSTDANDLRGGSTTDGVSFGADLALGFDLTVSATGTMGRTHQTSGGQALAVAGGGLTTSSYEFAVSKLGVFGPQDRVRMSLAQPMYVEAGRLSYTEIEVVDRSTGELGAVTQTHEASQGTRPYVAEFLYGRSVMAGAGEVGLFGRAMNRSTALDGAVRPELVAGARFNLSY